MNQNNLEGFALCHVWLLQFYYQLLCVCLRIFCTTQPLYSTYRKVCHKNVVQSIGACTKPSRLCIITGKDGLSSLFFHWNRLLSSIFNVIFYVEFMSGGILSNFLHKKKGFFRLPTLLKVSIDVSKGMSYLRQNYIILRDLKTAKSLNG
ncbi:hypothetical protein R3W88_007672 [Solanum pinnatisectum]|uniref:Protein kinase domain-containing protein n=1 Tax=Solanum pinnatisectum TaxID=50273 RepID=A0AAV9M6I2_9SOLN|nr:hypothetical protein R3W88_007672 [Solanum pinnatisectum]